MAIERIFVAGAGLMGHGIGQVHAAIGKEVTLYEPDLARAQAGRDRIAGNLDRAVAKGKLDVAGRDATLARIAVTDDLTKARDADLVVEAVFEDVDVKRELWRELGGPIREGVVPWEDGHAAEQIAYTHMAALGGLRHRGPYVE